MQSSSSNSPHVAKANQYIRDVLGGTIPASKWTRLACQRHLDDLAKPDFPYRFDNEAAERVCEFVEIMPHVKGKKFAGKPLILEPWQCFIVTTAFGWLDKTTELRRFRRVYVEVSKGNGKSPLVAALCAYMGFADNEPGAEVYTSAVAVQQARVVYDTTKAMLDKVPKYTKRAGITVGQHIITQAKTNSFIRPLSRDAKIAEGANPYFICADEVHVWPNRELFDNLVTANEKRDGSMMFCITTAGTNLTSVCHEQHAYLKQILEGLEGFEDDTYFGCIWSIDDTDDPWNETSWRKANPNWGVSVNPKSLRDEAKRAQQSPPAQAAFLTKHLDVWCQTDSAWLDIRALRTCADPALKLSDFAGQPCVIGLDLASKLDLLAKLRLFWRHIGGKRHIYAFGDYWTPEARLDSNSAYRGWATAGRLHAVPGEVNDYELVEDAIRQDCKQFQVLEVAYDPYQAVELVSHLTAERIPVVEVPQQTRQMDPAMKEFEALVADGRFHYDGDPVLTWALSNVVCHLDRNDCLFPNKQTPENKIDPATALLTGLFRLVSLAATGKLDPPKPRRTEILIFSLDE